jgi:hypothetical protein
MLPNAEKAPDNRQYLSWERIKRILDAFDWDHIEIRSIEWDGNNNVFSVCERNPATGEPVKFQIILKSETIVENPEFMQKQEQGF